MQLAHFDQPILPTMQPIFSLLLLFLSLLPLHTHANCPNNCKGKKVFVLSTIPAFVTKILPIQIVLDIPVPTVPCGLIELYLPMSTKRQLHMAWRNVLDMALAIVTMAFVIVMQPGRDAHVNVDLVRRVAVAMVFVHPRTIQASGKEQKLPREDRDPCTRIGMDT